MKTAILFVGTIRTWDSCKENFLQTLGNRDADVFVTTYDLQYAYHPYIRQSLNFHQDYYLDTSAIEQKFEGINLKRIMIDNIDTYVDEHVKPYISAKYPSDAYLSLSQYFKLRDGMQMIRDEEQKTGVEYDCIIKTRSDIIYNQIDDLDISDSVYVDGSGAGVFPCDWIFISNRKNAFQLTNFIEEEMKDMKHESSLVDMPHKLFLNGINSTGATLKLLPLVKGLVRAR